MLDISYKNFLKTKQTFLIFILFSVSCSSTKEVTFSPATLDIWDLFSYYPDSENQIIGEYFYSTGFTGEYLKLEADGSYYQKHFGDLQDPADIIDGYRGHYQVRDDSLFLTFESFQLKSKQGKSYQKVDSLIYNSMYAWVILPSTDSLTYEDRVKKALEYQEQLKNDEQFSSYHQSNFYYLKRAGEIVFLVKSNLKDFFLYELEAKKDLLNQDIGDGQKILLFHLTRLKG